MHVYRVIVGVALARPPKVDEYRLVLVSAWSRTEAELVACQIAGCTSVMPVRSEVVGQTFESHLDGFMLENHEVLRRLAQV